MITASLNNDSIKVFFIGLIIVTALQLPVTATTVRENTQSPLDFDSINYNDNQLFFAFSGDTTKPGILFIHGTPGGWQAFERYLVDTSLQENFLLVAVDRPGWGNSPLPSSEINGSFETQSNGIAQVLKRFPNKKWIIVGHSLGASLAPQIALDYPDQIQGLLLLAGSLKPSLGSPRWYNYAANTWVVSKLIGSKMKYSNREIMSLRSELTKMDSRIRQSDIEDEVIIMQGQKDRLVSPKNPQYAVENWAQNFSNIDLIELENEGHFLPWKQTSLVVKLIHTLSERINKER